MVSHGGAEAPCSSPPRTHCPRLLGFKEIQLTHCCLCFSAVLAFDRKTCFTVTPCKTRLAHCFLQNRFPLKKMLPHKQRVQWPLQQFSLLPQNWGPQRAGSPLWCHQDGSHLCRLASQGPEGMAWGRHGQALSLAGGIHTADKNLVFVSTQPGQTGHLK